MFRWPTSEPKWCSSCSRFFTYVTITSMNIGLFFVDALARLYGNEDFPYPNGTSSTYSINLSTENGSHDWTRFCVHRWIYFHAPRPCGSTSTLFLNGWHSWIIYGRNFATFRGICNDVLNMLNCWNACQLKVLGWSSKNAWTRYLLYAVTPATFLSDAFILASQTLPKNSNLNINL